MILPSLIWGGVGGGEKDAGYWILDVWVRVLRVGVIRK